MATVEQILNTDLPTPTFALRPTEAAPLSAKTSFSRSSGAWTLSSSGIYKYRSDNTALAYGKQQSFVSDGQLTNFVNHRHVGSGGWQVRSGSPTQPSTSKPDITGGTNAAEIGDDNTSDIENFYYDHPISNSHTYWTGSIWLDSETFSGGNPSVNLTTEGGTESRAIQANIHSDGTHTITYKKNGTENDESLVTRKIGRWIKVIVTLSKRDNTNIRLRVDPVRYANDGDTSGDQSLTGSCVVDAPMIISNNNRQLLNGNGPVGVYDAPPILAESISTYPAQVVKNQGVAEVDLSSVWNDYEGTFFFDVSITAGNGASPLRGKNVNSDYCQINAGGGPSLGIGVYNADSQAPGATPTIQPGNVAGVDNSIKAAVSMTRSGSGKSSITYDFYGTLDGSLGNLLDGQVFRINERGKSPLYVNEIAYYPEYLTQQTREILVS